MAKLQITGRVIALSPIREVASSTGKEPIKKRELYLDMTMYDPYTGERSENENKPLLEFGGDKVLSKLEALKLVAGDVVTVSFAIQGTPYKDKQTGKNRVFTAIRCYDIDVVRKAGQQAQAAAQPVQTQPTVLGGPNTPPITPETAPQVNGSKEEPLPF